MRGSGANLFSNNAGSSQGGGGFFSSNQQSSGSGFFSNNTQNTGGGGTSSSGYGFFNSRPQNQQSSSTQSGYGFFSSSTNNNTTGNNTTPNQPNVKELYTGLPFILPSKTVSAGSVFSSDTSKQVEAAQKIIERQRQIVQDNLLRDLRESELRVGLTVLGQKGKKIEGEGNNDEPEIAKYKPLYEGWQAYFTLGTTLPSPHLNRTVSTLPSDYQSQIISFNTLVTRNTRRIQAIRETAQSMREGIKGGIVGSTHGAVYTMKLISAKMERAKRTIGTIDEIIGFVFNRLEEFKGYYDKAVGGQANRIRLNYPPRELSMVVMFLDEWVDNARLAVLEIEAVIKRRIDEDCGYSIMADLGEALGELALYLIKVSKRASAIRQEISALKQSFGREFEPQVVTIKDDKKKDSLQDRLDGLTVFLQ